MRLRVTRFAPDGETATINCADWYVNEGYFRFTMRRASKKAIAILRMALINYQLLVIDNIGAVHVSSLGNVVTGYVYRPERCS